MSKPLIMIVDDEKEYADNIKNLIDHTGKYATIAAYSAREGLAILERNRGFWGLFPNRVKLVILDLKMPEMDGLEFLVKIRKEYHERIGVIILTAFEDEEKWNKARDGMAAGYVVKPVKEDDLLKQLENFFSGLEEDMIRSTQFLTDAKIRGAQIKRDFDVEKIREKIWKQKAEEEQKYRKD